MRICDRGNIDVPNGEGSCPHERHESESEDDEDVYKAGHEVHYVVNRGEMAFRCGMGLQYLPESLAVHFCPFKSQMSPDVLCVRRPNFGLNLVQAMRSQKISPAAAVRSGE